MSRAYTEAEARELFLARLDELVRFRWGVDNNNREKGRSLVADILSIIDGRSQELPGMELMLRPHANDKADAQGEGRNWYQPGQIINSDPLAGEWRKYGRKEVEPMPSD